MLKMLQMPQYRSTGKGRGRINFPLQDDGDFAAQYIAHHPAESRRDHPHDDRDEPSGPRDTEDRKPERIEPKQQPVARFRNMRGEKGNRGNGNTDRDLNRLANPEYRLRPEHQVA